MNVQDKIVNFLGEQGEARVIGGRGGQYFYVSVYASGQEQEAVDDKLAKLMTEWPALMDGKMYAQQTGLKERSGWKEAGRAGRYYRNLFVDQSKLEPGTFANRADELEEQISGLLRGKLEGKWQVRVSEYGDHFGISVISQLKWGPDNTGIARRALKAQWPNIKVYSAFRVENIFNRTKPGWSASFSLSDGPTGGQDE